MRALVCIKRVPLTGGRILLTDDAMALDTRHLGFTISPHDHNRIYAGSQFVHFAAEPEQFVSLLIHVHPVARTPSRTPKTPSPSRGGPG